MKPSIHLKYATYVYIHHAEKEFHQAGVGLGEARKADFKTAGMYVLAARANHNQADTSSV